MDLVTFGEAMVRFSPPPLQRLEQARALEATVGGSELNVAVLAARLGLKSRWVSRLPDNALGRMIEARAREQGVDAQVEWTADGGGRGGGRVGLYFVEIGGARVSSVLYDRAGSAFSRVTPGTIDWASVFAGARWYHVSGITPALSDGAAKVTAESLAAARKAGLTVSYDLNYRPKLWTATQACAVQEPLLEHVDVLIASEEDARKLFGAESAESLAQRFDIGAIAITLRDNPRSATVAAGGKLYSAPRLKVESVDPIGAGDAFTGGLIVSRLEHRDWDDAIRFATATAALKHTIPGDFCLVTRNEVEQLLRSASARVSR